MLAFIKEFLKEKSRDKKSNPNYSISSIDIVKSQRKTVRYDPQLIDTFVDEHNELLHLFGCIWKDAFEQRDYAKLSALLADFKAKFQSHILKENVKFYVFLKQSFSQDEKTLQHIKCFRDDINELANSVIKFCKKYNGEDLSAKQLKEFEIDYVKLGDTLTRRLKLEERDLYRLYQAP